MPASHVFNPFISQLTTSGAAPPAKAYTSAVQAGDVLWTFVWVNSATTTVTGVSDSLNGAWTQVFGPVRGDSNNFNATLYGFCFPNSAAGTPTVTVSVSANTQGGFVLGAVRGLAGGGALDQYVASKIVGPAVGYQLTTAALAHSGEAGVAFICASAGPTTPLWTAAGNVDSVNFERGQLTITADAGAQTVGTVGASSGTGTLGAMFFKDLAVATLGGNVTLDDATPGGGMSSVASSLSGNVTLDDAAPAGTLGAAPGTFTSEALKDWTGTVQANTALTFYRLYNPSTGALVVSRTDLSTDGSGVVTFTDGSVTPGTTYASDWLTAGGARRMPTKAAT